MPSALSLSLSRGPDRRFLFLTIVVLVMSTMGCSTIDPHKDLGQPRPDELSSKWSQLEKGMNQNQIRALLGIPPHFEYRGGGLLWGYSFGTVTFTGASSSNMLSGTDGSLKSWKRGR